jgi:hypothetical protein
MIDYSTIKANYSANVAIWLVVAGVSYAVAKTGPTYVVLRKPADIPASIGTLRVVVDGRERDWPVRIGGSVPFEDRVTIADCR